MTDFIPWLIVIWTLGAVLGMIAFGYVFVTQIVPLFSCHTVSSVQTITGNAYYEFPLSAKIICTKGYVVEEYSFSGFQSIYGCLTMQDCLMTDKQCLVETYDTVCGKGS